MKKIKKITVGRIIKEIDELEPKNIIDYIFKGSGFNQWARKHLCYRDRKYWLIF